MFRDNVTFKHGYVGSLASWFKRAENHKHNGNCANVQVCRESNYTEGRKSSWCPPLSSYSIYCWWETECVRAGKTRWTIYNCIKSFFFVWQAVKSSTLFILTSLPNILYTCGGGSITGALVCRLTTVLVHVCGKLIHWKHSLDKRRQLAMFLRA